MASIERDNDRFITVGRDKEKKRKAESSPLLQTPTGSSSASIPGSQTRPKPSSFDYPNSIPVIFRYADPKFTNVELVMSEPRQYHPDLIVSTNF